MIEPGDRVMAKNDHFCGVDIGDGNVGTVVIVKTAPSFPEVGVQWDEKFYDGHSCAGWTNGAVYKDGHCRWGNAKELIIIGKVEEVTPQYWIKDGLVVHGMTPIKESS